MQRIFHNWQGLGNYSRDLVRGLNKFNPENQYYLYTPPYNDPRAQQFDRKFKFQNNSSN